MRPLAIALDIISAVVVLSATLCYDGVTSALPTKHQKELTATGKPSGWPVSAEGAEAECHAEAKKKRRSRWRKKLKSEQNRKLYFSSEA